MKFRILATVWLALNVAPATAQVRSGNPLAEARELYASARYDEALAVLNGLRRDDAPVPERRSIAQYRSLCLLALGRGEEAEEAIAAVITADPMFQPSEADAAPRVRAAFSDVRLKLLPEIAAARYTEAKAVFDRKDHVAAERHFRELLRLLDDPQMSGRLADMRVLVAGFLELSAAAAAPPPPPPPAPEPKKVEAPPPPPAPVVDPNRTYGSDDAGVVEPVTQRQELPRVPQALSNHLRANGMLEIIIDERGRVTYMTMRVGVHPQYDALVLAAAKDWKYQPATFAGVPVKFRKLIRIVTEK
jgi:tetratricopeptide (TPR) repeat protein